jgi:hypothetical protein
MRYLLLVLGVWAIGWMGFAVRAEEKQQNQLRTFTYDPADLQASKARFQAGDVLMVKAVKDVCKQAETALTSPNRSVMDKPFMPPSGDKHDYMSLSPYWWPDPSKPDGKPYIRKDGQVNPERDKYDQNAIEAFTQEADALGLAFYFTGDEKYASKAAEKIRVFLFDPATRMNPNCKYGQFVPGSNEMRGVGVMEINRMRRVIDAEALIMGSKSWTSSDHEQLQGWIREFLTYITTSEQGRKERDAKNNHGTWFDVQAVTYSLYLGDVDAAKKMINDLTIPRIRKHIKPDGSQPEELVRTKAYDYCRYNLEAMVILSRLAEHVDIDLWNFKTEDGRSIRAAADWLAPYASGDKKWEHEQIYEAKMFETTRVYRQLANGSRDAKYEKVVQQARQRGNIEPGDRVDLCFPAHANP